MNKLLAKLDALEKEISNEFQSIRRKYLLSNIFEAFKKKVLNYITAENGNILAVLKGIDLTYIYVLIDVICF